MIGNVWEWTHTPWGKDLQKLHHMYSCTTDNTKRETLDVGDGISRLVRGGSWSDHRVDARCAFRNWSRPDNPRLVRGGSWSDHRVDVRCAFRNWSRPDNRSSGLGFRVVLRSALVS